MNQLYATKKDLQAVKNELLNKLASKDELKQAVEQITINTRDIKAMRNDIGLLNVDMGNVKSDLQTVKSDLRTVQSDMRTVQSEIGSMQITIVNMKADIAELETKKDATKKFTILVGMIEGIAKNIDSFKTELTAHNHAFMRYDSKLANHEERIIKLESSRN